MSAIDSFRTTRWIRTANLLLQAVLLLTLAGGINYLAGNHAWSDDPWRYDLTRYRRYSLSPETLAYLKELQNPVRIIVTEDEASADPEVKGLLREYAYATEANPTGRITVEYMDIYLRRTEAELLGIDQAGKIVFICGDKHGLLTIKELYDDERMAFRGEQAITGQILNVSSPERKRIYFLVGNAELRPDAVDPIKGLSTARNELRARNFDVETLDLSTARAIPADASLLIAVDPKEAYTGFEQELLRQYVGAKAGRLILFLAPGHPRFGLDRLLSDWGVVVDDDLIRDPGTENETEDGDLIIRDFAAHPATTTLRGEKVGLRIGPARSVRPDPARAAGNDLDCVTLAATSPSAWGEVSFGLRDSRPYNPSVDIRPRPGMDPPDRLGVAVASERVAARENLPFSVPGGRLVVVGTGDLIANSRIDGIGALDFLLGAVNWTVNRDTQLNIPARPIERFQLSLSAGELHKLRFCLLLGLPGAAALLGVAVYLTRRS